jgi:RNase P subunit RPR2
MRTPEKAKSNTSIKAPLKGKGSLEVRLPIKKIYCTKCQRLIKGKIQNSGGTTQVICPKCSQSLRTWNHILWRSVELGAGK